MNKLIEQVLKRFDEKFKWFPMMSPNNEVKGKPMVKQFLKEELTNLIEKVREEEKEIVNNKICNLMGWEENQEYDRGLEELLKNLIK